MKQRILYGLISIVTILITFLNLSTTISLAAQEVNLTILPDPYIDIVLATGSTTTDVTNFESDIRKALVAQGVNTNLVNISSVETVQNEVSSEDLNVDEIINNWEVIGADTWRSYYGEIFSSTGGGYQQPAWWGTALIDPDGYQAENITMDFTMVTGGRLNEGVCFNVTKNSDGSLNGYFIAICNHSNTQCALFRFKHYTLDQPFDEGINKIIWCGPHRNGWNKGQTYTSGADSYTVLETWDIGVSSNVRYHVESKNGNIKVQANNKTVVNLTDRTYTKGSYGFWGNNCEASTYMYLKDIKISTTIQKSKTFSEVLREPDWRENAIKVLVSVEDPQNAELTNSSILGELLTRLLNENIYFVSWGKNANQSQFQSLIHANNDNGRFINNTNYNNSINQTAIYIKSLIDQMEQKNNYLLLEDHVKLNITPAELAKNTADATYPNGKWKIDHDFLYYENHIGQYAQSGQYTSNFLTEFNKTGKYSITYADAAIAPSEVYVHRRPVALLKSTKNGNSLTLMSDSYDLDMYSIGSKGIAAEEWKYKKTTDSNWTNGKITTISGDADYVVQLRVKDNQGVWSYPVSIYATNRSSALPIATFGIRNREFTRYEKLELIDNSYDPYGGTITSKTWEIYKGNTRIYNGSNPPTDFFNYGVGDYTVSLVVKNNRGQTSEKYSKTFKVIEDEIAPEVTASPMECDWSKQVTVHLEFTDQGGSGFKYYQYAITNNQTRPTAWSSPIAKTSDNITINEEGIKYLHIIARDNAGNVSEDRVLGPYRIDHTPPEYQIDYEPKGWVIDYITISWNFTDSQSGYRNAVLPDGTTTTESKGQYIVEENGDYVFRAYDQVGNETLVTVEITKIDKIAPEGVLRLDNTELTDENVNILWELQDGQSGFSKVLLPNAEMSENSTGSYPVDKMGTYSFIVYDQVGNETTLTIEVNNVDRIAPTLTITQKVTKWVNEPVELNWLARDYESGLREVVLPNAKMSQSGEGSHFVTRNGVYTFLAYDQIGNGTLVRHEVNNIDVTAPYIVLSRIENERGEPQIHWELQDDQSGVRDIILPNSQRMTQASGNFYVDEPGMYTFLAYDQVGNERKESIYINIE